MKKNRKLSSFNSRKSNYNSIWTKERPLSFITESYQKFLANLEYVNIDKKYKVIHVTSSVTGEGKTTFQSNIAYLLAQKNYKTILVDLDLRKPKVHRVFGVENINGVTDLLMGKTNLDEAIKKSKNLGFDVLTSGEKTSAVINLIQSDKMKTMFEQLRERYDYILIDSPPVVNVSDALYISKLSDAVIFVIAQSKTKRVMVREAINTLQRNDVNIIGAVATQVDIYNKRYGYGYGYGYSYSYDYDSVDD